jgi:hypothetical protein
MKSVRKEKLRRFERLRRGSDVAWRNAASLAYAPRDLNARKRKKWRKLLSWVFRFAFFLGEIAADADFQFQL